MIRMINRQTGGTMWVADDRVEEYLGLGHKLPAPPAPANPIRSEDKASGSDTKKTTRKRK